MNCAILSPETPDETTNPKPVANPAILFATNTADGTFPIVIPKFVKLTVPYSKAFPPDSKDMLDGNTKYAETAFVVIFIIVVAFLYCRYTFTAPAAVLSNFSMTQLYLLAAMRVAAYATPSDTHSTPVDMLIYFVAKTNNCKLLLASAIKEPLYKDKDLKIVKKTLS